MGVTVIEQGVEQAPNPLELLSPHHISANRGTFFIYLGAELVSVEELRDAAIYVRDALVDDSVTVTDDTAGNSFVLKVSYPYGDTPGQKALNKLWDLVAPALPSTATLSGNVERGVSDKHRKHVATQVAVTFNGQPNPVTDEELSNVPGVMRGRVDATARTAIATFTVKNPTLENVRETITRVAALFGGFVDATNFEPADADPNAKLNPEYDYEAG